MRTNVRELARGDWLEAAARVGYATKGVIYLLIGALAITAAVGSGGAIGGGETAVRTIGQQPFGQLLLIVTGVGLLAYALWRFVQAALDPEREGDDARGIGRRVAYAVSGAIYGLLGATALQLALGDGGGGGGVLGKVWSLPGGEWIVGAAGAAVLAYAAHQLHAAWKGDVGEHLKANEMSAKERLWAMRSARAGLAARAIVLVIVGVGMIRAALRHDPAQVRGVGEALREIGSQPFGMFLLFVVAVGLMAYGVYQLAQARYRRIAAR